MQTYETILARRSVRRFTDQPIEDEIINRLLNCAMAGPSACNYRPWAFYVVKTRKSGKCCAMSAGFPIWDRR